MLLAYSYNIINLVHLIRSSVRDPMYEMVDLSLNEPSNDMSATSKHKPLQQTSDTDTKNDSYDHTSENRIVPSPSKCCHPTEYLTSITSEHAEAKLSEVQTDNNYQPMIPPPAQQNMVSSDYQSLTQAKSSVVNRADEENTYCELVNLSVNNPSKNTSSMNKHEPLLQTFCTPTNKQLIVTNLALNHSSASVKSSDKDNTHQQPSLAHVHVSTVPTKHQSLTQCESIAVVRHAVLEQYNDCRSRKCIRDCIPMYIFSAVYFLYFLQALFVSDFTSKTPNKDQQVEQPFFCPFVYVL